MAGSAEESNEEEHAREHNEFAVRNQLIKFQATLPMLSGLPHAYHAYHCAHLSAAAMFVKVLNEKNENNT